jgi:hypothetical protein
MTLPQCNERKHAGNNGETFAHGKRHPYPGMRRVTYFGDCKRYEAQDDPRGSTDGDSR